MFATLDPEAQVQMYTCAFTTGCAMGYSTDISFYVAVQMKQGCKEPAIFLESAQQLDVILRTMRLWMPWLKLLLFLRDPGEHIVSARYMDAQKVHTIYLSY